MMVECVKCVGRVSEREAYECVTEDGEIEWICNECWDPETDWDYYAQVLSY